MGTIKKLYQDQLVGGSGSAGQEVYPVTSTLGVYDEDNTQLQDVLDKVTTNLGLFTCGTAAATAAKTVTASKFVLMEGGSIKIKFTYANSADSPTLAIGSTAAKPIMFNDSAASASNTWGAGDIVEFCYDGTNWVGSKVVPVSVSQNTTTIGDKVLMIGDTPTGIVKSNFINVNDFSNHPSAFSSRADARMEVLIYSGCRRFGQVLTYLVNENNATHWVTEMYIGADASGWNTASNWNDLDVKIQTDRISGFPNAESITIPNGGSFLLNPNNPLCTFSLFGDGTKYQYKYIKVTNDCQYKIKLSKTNWNVTGISGVVMFFGYILKDAESGQNYRGLSYTTATMSSIKDEYILNPVNDYPDCEYIYVGFRADAGESVDFFVEAIPMSKDIGERNFTAFGNGNSFVTLYLPVVNGHIYQLNIDTTDYNNSDAASGTVFALGYNNGGENKYYNNILYSKADGILENKFLLYPVEENIAYYYIIFKANTYSSLKAQLVDITDLWGNIPVELVGCSHIGLINPIVIPLKAGHTYNAVLSSNNWNKSQINDDALVFGLTSNGVILKDINGDNIVAYKAQNNPNFNYIFQLDTDDVNIFFRGNYGEKVYISFIDITGLKLIDSYDMWINRYPEIIKSLPIFRNKIYNHEDVNVVMLGDSFFAAQMTATLNDNPANLPPQCARNHVQYQIWKKLCFNKPQYDRWDSQINTFVESGTFNESGADFPTIWDTADMTDKMQAKNTGAALDRFSSDNNANIAFLWDMDAYEKLNFIYRKSNNINSTDEALGTSSAVVSISEGSGKALVYNGAAWVEANGFTFSMRITDSGDGYAKTMPDVKLKFKRVTTDSITVTISNNANDGLLYYWGTERWNGGSLFIANIARGGFSTPWLQQNIINDIGERDCDLLLFELPLTNDSYGLINTIKNNVSSIIQGGSGDWKNTANFKSLSENFTKFDLLCVVPHIGTRFMVANSNDYKRKTGEPDYVTYKQYFDAMRGLLESLGIAFIPFYKDWIDSSRYIYKNYYLAGVDRQSDDVHPNDIGCSVYAQVIEPVIEI